MASTNSRFPTLHRDPTLSVLAASHQSVVGSDRLEVVHTPAPRRPPALSGRHRRTLGKPPVPGLPAGTGSGLVLLLLTVVAAFVSSGLRLPGPLLAVGVVAVLGSVGAPLVRAARLPLPDPLVRAVVAVAGGLVLLSALAALLDVLAPTARPGALTCLLGVDVLVVLLHVLARWSVGPATGLPRPTWPGLRTVLPWAAPVVLPVLGWLDATGTATSPGWLRAAVLIAALLLLTHSHVSAEDGNADRVRTAAILYAIALGVLTPLAHPGVAGGPAWTSTLARTGGATPEEVARIVLPAVSGLVVVVAWLTAERVLGAARAVLVAALVLAVLLATPATWGDLPVATAVLLLVAGRGAHSAGSLLSRRVAVVVLSAGALVLAPSTTVFAAQLCLATLLAVLVGRPARGVLTLPLAVAVAAAVWIATMLRERSGLDGGPWTTTAVVVAGAAALGFAALLLGRARPQVRDREFLLVALSGLALELAATLGSGGSVVAHVLVALTAPAVLGISAAWGLLAGGLGATLDRVPGGLLRSPARATRTHRLPPARLSRTAAVALGLLALEYLRRALG